MSVRHSLTLDSYRKRPDTPWGKYEGKYLSLRVRDMTLYRSILLLWSRSHSRGEPLLLHCSIIQPQRRLQRLYLGYYFSFVLDTHLSFAAILFPTILQVR